MSFLGLIAICTEQPIPPWQVKSIIAIGFLDNHGVMHTVHVWSDNKVPEYAVDLRGKMDITVVEHGCPI
jgi:hypothetical protein